MATKKIEIQDSNGNVYYPHTDASVVKNGSKTVAEQLNDISIDVKIFGAKGNANFYNSENGKYYEDENYTIESNDDTEAFKKAIEYCAKFKSDVNPPEYYLSVDNPKLYIPNGNFLITSGLKTNKPISIVGNYHRSNIVFKSIVDGDILLEIKESSDFMGRNFGGMLYGLEIGNFKITSDREYQNNGINLQKIDGIKVHDILAVGFRGYGYKSGTRESLYSNIRTLYCGDLANKIPDILLGYDEVISERPNENKYVDSFFIYSSYSLVDTFGEGCYMETFDNCMFHNIAKTSNGQEIFNSMFPRDIQGCVRYTAEEEYSKIAQINAKKGEIHFNNCTHRICGNKMFFADDNSEIKVTNSKYVGNFIKWDSTDEEQKNYIAYATNNSHVYIKDSNIIDTYKMQYSDETSTVTIDNADVGSLQAWEFGKSNKTGIINKMIRFINNIYLSTITGNDNNTLTINAISSTLGSVRNLAINMRNKAGSNSSRFYFAGNLTDRWYMKFINGSWLHLSEDQSTTKVVNANSSSITVDINEMPSNIYKVFITTRWFTNYRVINKTTTNFTIEFENAPVQNSLVDILIIPTEG